MTNREMLINLLKEKDTRALPMLDCPIDFVDCCAMDAKDRITSCDQCQIEWLDAEAEE